MNDTNRSKPMSSAPYVYDEKGNIAWDQMWTNFCVLAKEGGPPHRGTKLHFKSVNDTSTEDYQNAAKEIHRAYKQLTPYRTKFVRDGHISIHLHTYHKAKWFRDSIVLENVDCTHEKNTIILPINDDFTESEIKNVVTVVAKAHHYWQHHRSWFARAIIHLSGQDLEAGLWE